MFDLHLIKNYLLSFLLFFIPLYAESAYYIQVSLHQQTIFIFENDLLVKSMPCSTGILPGSTPTGKFSTYAHKDKKSWLHPDGSKISYWYITNFHGDIGFHSMLEGDHDIVVRGQELFAQRQPSSHGCIRLRKEDALWIYKLPLGVAVEIID